MNVGYRTTIQLRNIFVDFTRKYRKIFQLFRHAPKYKIYRTSQDVPVYNTPLVHVMQSWHHLTHEGPGVSFWQTRFRKSFEVGQKFAARYIFGHQAIQCRRLKWDGKAHIKTYNEFNANFNVGKVFSYRRLQRLQELSEAKI